MKNRVVKSVAIKLLDGDDLVYEKVWFKLCKNGGLSIKLRDGSKCFIASGKWQRFFTTSMHANELDMFSNEGHA